MTLLIAVLYLLVVAIIDCYGGGIMDFKKWKETE